MRPEPGPYRRCSKLLFFPRGELFRPGPRPYGRCSRILARADNCAAGFRLNVVGQLPSHWHCGHWPPSSPYASSAPAPRDTLPCEFKSFLHILHPHPLQSFYYKYSFSIRRVSFHYLRHAQHPLHYHCHFSPLIILESIVVLHPDAQILKSQTPKVGIPKSRSLKIRSPEIRKSENLKFRKSENPEIRNSINLKFRSIALTASKGDCKGSKSD